MSTEFLNNLPKDRTNNPPEKFAKKVVAITKLYIEHMAKLHGLELPVSAAFAAHVMHYASLKVHTDPQVKDRRVAEAVEELWFGYSSLSIDSAPAMNENPEPDRRL